MDQLELSEFTEYSKMKTEKETEEEKKKRLKKEQILASCNENAFIVDKNKVREGLGLTSNAKILMD